MPKTAALKSLHTDLIDTARGYEEAVKDTDTPELKALFEKMRGLHGQAHNDVHQILLSKGEQPDESGSFMSLVHKTVISVRSAVTGLNRPSLEAFATGEEHIVSAYDKAIEESGDDTSVVERLSEHKRVLLDMIAQMKSHTVFGSLTRSAGDSGSSLKRVGSGIFSD